MAVVAKRFAKGITQGTNNFIAHTAITGAVTVIKAFTLCNTTASNLNITITLAETEIIKNHVIKAYDTITLPFLDQIIIGGETVKIQGSAAGITYYISGKEVT